jgi:type I restriction enzyme M protein
MSNRRKKDTDRDGTKNGKKLATQQSVDSAVWAICDIMRRGNVASALQYVPELTWILFLRILDESEAREEMEAKALGHSYTPSIGHPYRWSDWARPIPAKADKSETNQRRRLTEEGAGKLLEFVNTKLIPYLKKLRDRPDATPRQKVIAEILSGVEKVRIDTETNLLEVLDKVHEISQADIDPTHVVALSQVYEGLLLRMGDKGSDAGQFFTPREVSAPWCGRWIRRWARESTIRAAAPAGFWRRRRSTCTKRLTRRRNCPGA